MAAHAHLAAAAAAASGQHPFMGSAGAHHGIQHAGAQHPALAAAAMAAMAMHQGPMLAQHPAAAGMFAHLSSVHPALRGHPMALMAAAAIHQHQQRQQQEQQQQQQHDRIMAQPGQVRPPLLGSRSASGLQAPLPVPSAQQSQLPAAMQLQASGPANFHAELNCTQAPLLGLAQSSPRLDASQAGVACETGAIGAQEQQVMDFKQHLHQQLQLAAAAAAAAATCQYHQQSNSDDHLDSANSAARRSLVRPWEG